MIWFACKQCGKRHGRDDALAGTLVFCECGHGNRVPWSSTAAEPEPQPSWSPSPLPRRPPLAQPAHEDDRPAAEFLRPRRSRERRRPNPAYCLNHEDAVREAVCDACQASFCSACVVDLNGQTYCGPCKNFRVGGLNRPARVLPLAVVAFVLALVCTLVSLVLTLVAVATADSALAVALPCCVIALALATGELIVGCVAVRQIDRQPTFGGRGLAMTGAAAGLVGAMWSLSIAVLSIVKHAQG